MDSTMVFGTICSGSSPAGSTIYFIWFPFTSVNVPQSSITKSTSAPIPNRPPVKRYNIPVPILPTANLCIPSIPKKNATTAKTHLTLHLLADSMAVNIKNINASQSESSWEGFFIKIILKGFKTSFVFKVLLNNLRFFWRLKINLFNFITCFSASNEMKVVRCGFSYCFKYFMPNTSLTLQMLPSKYTTATFAELMMC